VRLHEDLLCIADYADESGDCRYHG
jgi:hypothetical protein